MGRTRWPHLQLTEVDGVRAVWADVPGPLRAGLVVRVGSADETLPYSGISHLLEHLALHGIARPGQHANGFTDQTVTMYHCTGDADVVRTFLTGVTRQLADPPLQRLADEVGVLRAEAALRRPSVEDTLLTWRYGAAGYGLAGQEELGVDRLTADDVQQWARRHATRGNSVLWFSGPPPDGLVLSLPDGEPVPPPDPRPAILPRLPAWFTGNDSAGVALHAVLERSWANPLLDEVLRDRLVDELRVRRAAAYSPQTDYRPLGRGAGRLLVMTDLVDGQQQEAVPAFLALLTDLGADRPPTDAELAAARARRQAQRAEPSAPLGFVTASAWNLAVGAELETALRAEESVAAVTPADVAAAARAAVASAVVVIPRGVRPDGGPWVEAPSSVHPALAGETFVGLPGGAQGELVLSPDGVTRRSGGSEITVPRAHAVAVQRWADGLRVLVADDANRVVVEPTLWVEGRRLVARIDELYPVDVVIEMAGRQVDEVPLPLVPQEQPAVGRASPAWAGRGRAGLVAAGGPALLAAAVGLGLVVGPGRFGRPGSAPAFWLGVGVALGVVVGAVVMAWWVRDRDRF